MAAVTTTRDQRGDLAAHIGGCADIKNRKHTSEALETIEAPTLVEALNETDRAWADSFGIDYPVPANPDSQPWQIGDGSIVPAPCLVDAMKLEGLRVVDGQWTGGAEAPSAPTGTCQCGCGGSPKGAKSRFLPGHDARVHGGKAGSLAPAVAVDPDKLRASRGPDGSPVSVPGRTESGACPVCGDLPGSMWEHWLKKHEDRKVGGKRIDL